MPDFESTAIVRSASSESIVDDENPVSATALEPKTTTATRSDGALLATNLRAAATASWSRLPFIDCERSIATTTLLAALRLYAFRSTTGRPFSVNVGALREATGATTVARMVG